MKKTYKILSVLMVVVMMLCISTNVFAGNPDPDADADKKIDTSIIDGLNPSAPIGDAGTTIQSLGSTILTIITTVGMILAVVLVAVLGIKYMMGSTEEKADYKKSMLPYLVGAVLVFGASAIGRAVVEFGASI